MLKEKTSQIYNKHKETGQNFFWRFSQIAAKEGTTFIIFFIAAYFLLPEDLGLYSYLMALVAILMIVADFGLSTSTSKYVVKLKTKNSESLKRVLFSVSLVVIGMALIVSVFLLTAGRFIFNEHKLLFLFLPYLFLFPLTSVVDGVYRGLKEFKKLSIINVIVAVFSLILSFFLIKQFGLIGAILSQNLLFLLLAISLFSYRKETQFRWDKRAVKNIMKYAIFLGIASIGYFLYTKVDLVILRHFGFIVEIGYYEIIEKIFKFAFIPAAILGEVIAPNMTGYFSKGNIERVYNKFKKSFLFFLPLAVLVSLVFYFILPVIINNFLPKYVTDSIFLISNLLLIVLPVRIVGAILAVGFYTSTGFAKVTSKIIIVFGVLNVLLDIIFVSKFGFIGVVYSTLILFYIQFILNIFLYRRWIKKRVN